MNIHTTENRKFICRISKYIYITIGIIALILGIVGIILPILPTTPFLLLTSFCFSRSSKRFNNWFCKTAIYKNYLQDFVEKRAMTLKRKIQILLFADLMILFPLIIVDKVMVKSLLVSIIIYKWYYFIFKIKTIKQL